jgi:hypothetical protein
MNSRVFDSTDIRFIGQRGGGVDRSPWQVSRSAHQDILMKETSGRPMQTLNVQNTDPVYNIAIQNPTAQPGGGAVSMAKHRNDMAELYGVQCRIPSIPYVPVYSRRFDAGNFTTYRVDPKSIQQAYFGGGGRPSGDALFIMNSDFGVDHIETNRQETHLKERKYARHNKEKQIAANNSVVYTGTALNALAAPEGSSMDSGGVNSGQTVDANVPPKAIVSSKDSTAFISY